MTLTKQLLGACVALLLVLAGSPAIAEDTWKLASAAQPGSLLAGIDDATAKALTEKSGGSVKVERLFVASEQEIVQQVVRGRLEMGSISYTGASVVVPEAALLNMPYLWSSEAEKDFVTDNYALPVMKKLYEAKGLVILGLGEIGWNDVVCKKACLTPADVKGMKVRVSPAASSKMFWSALEADGVPMPLSEMFTALQSGLVEGADLPFLFYVVTPAAKSAPHYVLTHHLHHGATTVMNKALWDKLTPDMRKTVVASITPVAELRKEVDDHLKPRMEDFKAKGGFIHELTPAQRAEWAKKVIPFQPQMIKDIGGQAQVLWEAIEAGKKAFAAKSGG